MSVITAEGHSRWLPVRHLLLRIQVFQYLLLIRREDEILKRLGCLKAEQVAHLMSARAGERDRLLNPDRPAAHLGATMRRSQLAAVLCVP